MKISVIIPVYNVAPYLSQCLESVINQSLKNKSDKVVTAIAIDSLGYEEIQYTLYSLCNDSTFYPKEWLQRKLEVQ